MNQPHLCMVHNRFNEAAAAGVPSIVAPGAGSADDLTEHGAGLVWDLSTSSLDGVLGMIRNEAEGFAKRVPGFADAMSFSTYAPRFVALYERTLERLGRSSS